MKKFVAILATSVAIVAGCAGISDATSQTCSGSTIQHVQTQNGKYRTVTTTVTVCKSQWRKIVPGVFG